MLKQLLKEPLVHFLFLGAGLFALFGLTNDTVTESDNEIVVTQADIDRLVASWQRSWNRLPSPTEVQQLIASYVEEEVLYREALAMGLEKDDPVVRRRMAQKLKFLFEDIATPAEPTDEQLRAYLDRHPDKFRLPARLTFSHIFLSVDQRGDQAYAEAEQLLQRLESTPDLVDLAQAGDSFMLDSHYADAGDFEISRVFGEAFTRQIMTLAPGPWHGPVESGYGLHLVQVQERVDAALPPLADIRDRVKTEYLADQRQEANEKFYEGLRQRYQVIVQQEGDGNKNIALGVKAVEEGKVVR